MARPYPGESDPKRLARALMYRRIRKLWIGKPPEGYVITLAGSEAAEIGAIRDYLGWSPHHTIFVDTDKTGLDVVNKSWPLARTHHGKIETVLKDLDGPVAFVNFDFMGSFNETVMSSISAVRSHLVPASIIAYTFSRGHEAEHTPNWDKARVIMKGFLARNPWMTTAVGDENSSTYLEASRFLGYAELIRKAVRKDMRLVYFLRYNRMGVLVLQDTSQLESNRHWKAVFNDLMPEEKTGDVVATSDTKATIKNLIIELFTGEKMTTPQIASFLNLPSLAVRAYRANWTRGAYD